MPRAFCDSSHNLWLVKRLTLLRKGNTLYVNHERQALPQGASSLCLGKPWNVSSQQPAGLVRGGNNWSKRRVQEVPMSFKSLIFFAWRDNNAVQFMISLISEMVLIIRDTTWEIDTSPSAIYNWSMCWWANRGLRLLIVFWAMIHAAGMDLL